MRIDLSRIEQGCAAYILLLENTSPYAPAGNRTHLALRGLYGYFGKVAVDNELERQFEERRHED